MKDIVGRSLIFVVISPFIIRVSEWIWFFCWIKLLAFKVNFYLDEDGCYLGYRTDLMLMSAVAGNGRDIWNQELSASQNHHDS